MVYLLMDQKMPSLSGGHHICYSYVLFIRRFKLRENHPFGWLIGVASSENNHINIGVQLVNEANRTLWIFYLREQGLDEFCF